jgi:transcription termination factor Rho
MLPPPMARASFADMHIAELHALASDAGVPGYRLLRRDDLAEKLSEAGVEPPERPRRSAHRRPADDERGQQRETPDAPTEEVVGVLDVLPQRYGFLRVTGLEAAPEDVYISASQIRRCELRTGDAVSGPAREPRRGERYRALVHVDKVNGAEATEEDGRRDFDEFTAVAPSRRIALDPDPGDVLVRAVDLLVPLARGQRVLVSAAPRSGRTTLLRNLAGALGPEPELSLIVLLVDERPEEATRWREALPGAEIAAATADISPKEQARVADMALARAKRRAESGDDVVLIVDSLSRLAVAKRGPDAAKALFGAGRELAEEGAGSLTVVATALEGSGPDEDDAVTAVATTENALIRLDPELAAAGVFPALRVAETRASDEAELREPAELEAVRRLRESLDGLEPRVAADTLREQLERAPTNAELLEKL